MKDGESLRRTARLNCLITWSWRSHSSHLQCANCVIAIKIPLALVSLDPRSLIKSTVLDRAIQYFNISITVHFSAKVCVSSLFTYLAYYRYDRKENVEFLLPNYIHITPFGSFNSIFILYRVVDKVGNLYRCKILKHSKNSVTRLGLLSNPMKINENISQ